MKTTPYYFDSYLAKNIDDQLLDNYIVDYIKQLFEAFPPNEAAAILFQYSGKSHEEFLNDAKTIAKELFPQHAQYIDAYELLK